MSYKSIRAALEVRLAALAPAMPTSYENGDYKQVVGTAYQKVTLIPNTTQTPTIAQDRLIEQGIFQVSVVYPFNSNTAPAITRAELIRSHFPAGLVLTNGGIKVRISKSPSIASAIPDDMWYAIPVSIPFICIK